MRHSTIASIATDGGIVLSPSRLKTIGIYDQSLSWAVWIPRAGDEDRGERPDLLISSLHPSTWPYTFALRLRLSHKVGSLARASAVLVKHGLSILSARCETTGYHHATWNVVCEAKRLRDKYDVKTPAEDLSTEDRERLASRITKALIKDVPEIADQITVDGADFLSERFLRGDVVSFREEHFEPEEWERNRQYRSKPVAFFFLPVLTYYWRSAYWESEDGGDTLLKYRFDKTTGRLSSDGHHLLEKLQRLGITTPTKALVSLDTDELFLRVRFFSANRIKHIFKAEIDYYYRFRRSGGLEETSSVGLIRDLAQQLESVQVNLLRASNSVREQDARSESGGVRFVGEAERPINDCRAEIGGALLSVDRNGLQITRHRVQPLPRGEVFLSAHLKGRRRDSIKGIFEKLVGDYGFELREAEVYDREVTKNVVKAVGRCVALIQVHSDRKHSDSDAAEWLTAEYAVALAKGLSCIRCVDISVPGYATPAKWRERLKLDKDHALVPFHGGDEREDIERSISVATRLFLRELAE